MEAPLEPEKNDELVDDAEDNVRFLRVRRGVLSVVIASLSVFVTPVVRVDGFSGMLA